MTEMVFDKPTMNFNDHAWVQRGYELTDACSPKSMSCEPIGIPIANGQMLVGQKGAYKLVDELSQR